RQVLVAPAPTAASSDPAPTVVLFHGFAGVADEFASDTGLLTEAAEHGVSVVVPFGLGEPPTWELGGGPVDDAGFAAELIADLASDPCVDPDRIWLAGYSAGAGFIGVQTCALQEHLAGIVMNAAVAPPLCDTVTGLDVVIAHGTADLVVPYDGLTIDAASGATLPSSPDLAETWATRLGCGAATDGATTDGFHQQRWTGCGESANTVDMLTYVGGGHRWPGRPDVGGEGDVIASPDLTCVVLGAVADADDPVARCLTAP
ncbi:alpha/beta hydrolase family esterase, partial [Ilumatobacter sp.]|uniref:alpha/beta hydrolase family esterase n=1 Tax=Ilumatobacter sp. TaxID=1967498 RepID=UPI003C42EAF6